MSTDRHRRIAFLRGLLERGPGPRAAVELSRELRCRTMVVQTKEGAVMTITSRIRRIVAAAAATMAVMAVGLPAAQADASVGSMSAKLTRCAPYSGASA